MSTPPYVVVGAGQAGLQICDSLRKEGYTGPLVLLGEEASLPYQRPPLSKKFLSGELEAERLLFRPQSYYDKIDVDVRLDVRVESLERKSHQLHLSDGSALRYARLALATGTRIRPLTCDGGDDARVHYVRTLDDSSALGAALPQCRSLAVIGGGFIGLEVAAMARGLGVAVTVIEAQERLMARAVSPQVSAYYAALHRAHGVDVRLDCGVDRINARDEVLEVVLTDGTLLTTDRIVAGIGVIPNTELAATAGIECRNGIVVDANARTSDPDIVAAGDCTMHFNGFLDREIRLESVQNAVDQAKVAAATLCDRAMTYRQVPWFWSDQYDVKLQMAGIGMPHDHAVQRGVTGDEGFSVFYFREGELVGADSINRPAEHMACRKLLAAGNTPLPDVLEDPHTDLMQLARDAATT